MRHDLLRLDDVVVGIIGEFRIVTKPLKVKKIRRTTVVLNDGTCLNKVGVHTDEGGLYFTKMQAKVQTVRYFIYTEELIEKVKKLEREYLVNNWFKNKNFTQDEKEFIYNMFHHAHRDKNKYYKPPKKKGSK